MRICLSLDTALQSLRLALVGEGVRLSHCFDMDKGQAEALFPAIDVLLTEAGLGFHDLACLAVNIGPGSFTGARVGVAAAKGLAFGLEKPLFGITTLQGVACQAPDLLRLVAMDARRDEVYVQGFDADNKPLSAPKLVAVSDLINEVPQGALVLGSAARFLHDFLPKEHLRHVDFADPCHLADLALAGHGQHGGMPFYLRDADAKPQSHKILPRA
jgi:tRNA threonylcarbamoyl adenosine modification protein YeaZ